METQLRYVTKTEAHKMIDDHPGSRIMVIAFDKVLGLSDKGLFIKKGKGKRMVNKASLLVLSSSSDPIVKLDIHNKFDYTTERIVKSILLHKTNKG